MDLSVVQEAISTFRTVVYGVIGVFQGFPAFIQDFAEFFKPVTVDGVDTTQGAVWAGETGGYFGSSKEAAAN